MNRRLRFHSCLLLLVIACLAAQAAGQSATAPAPAPGSQPVHSDDILTSKTAPFSFLDAPVDQVLSHIATAYGIVIKPHPTIDARITMKLPDPLTARQALNLLNDTLLPMGYAALETVAGSPPHVELEIAATTADPKSVVPVYVGSDPARIPGATQVRTQVITLTHADPLQARALAAQMLQEAVIRVSPATGRLYITDTAANIKLAAQALAAMDRQAGAATQRATATAPATGQNNPGGRDARRGG